MDRYTDVSKNSWNNYSLKLVDPEYLLERPEDPRCIDYDISKSLKEILKQKKK